MKDVNVAIWERFALLLGLLVAEPLASATAVETGAPAPPPPGERNPVVLIHGIHDSATSMRWMARQLRSQGWEVYTLSLVPNDGGAGLDVLARQVADFVGVTFDSSRRIDLVGFSMGGVVCRYYIQRLNGADRVDRFVTLASPHHGTWMAYLSGKPGVRQMRPTSPFLRDLNQDLTAFSKVQFTSIWTPLDLMILPAGSSRMPVGTQVQRWVVAHPLMILERKSLQAVTAALSTPVRDR